MKKSMLIIMLATTFVFSGIYSSTAYAETIWVNLVGDDMVIDTFNGVTANYTANYNSDSDKVYSCAAYVKKYYSKIYGVSVYNLIDNGPLKILESGNSLIKVSKPQVGDIIFYPTSKNKYNHSAIVKKVEGNTITLIEQNYKTGKIAAYARTITYPSDKFEIWRLADQSNINIPMEDTTNIMTASEDVIRNIASYIEKTISNVSGDFQNPKVSVNNDVKYPSYLLNNGMEYTFIVPREGVSCWYYDGNSFVLAEKLKVVTTTKAYFTFFKEDKYGLVEFKDLPNTHWAYSSLQKCVNENIIGLYEDGTIRPDSYISRKEFAVMIYNILDINLDEYVSNSTFADVNENDLHRPYIEAAKYYMLGVEENGQFKYRPLDYTTREDAFTAVIKMLSAPLNSNVKLAFTDADKITPELLPYIKKSVDLGLASVNNKSFRPQNYITRAEASLIFSNMF